MKIKHKKPSCILSTKEDFLCAQRTAGTLTRLFHQTVKRNSHKSSNKNDYAGFVLENNFYGQSATNAARSLTLLANIAFECLDLSTKDRLETLDYCIKHLEEIYEACLNYIDTQLEGDGTCYRAADMSEALTAACHGLIKSRQYKRQFPL